MEANEAPEKVYLHLTTGNRILSGKYYESKPAKIRHDDKIIEYICTDAFIEKAAEYLYKCNQDMVKRYGAKAVLGCSEYTINVNDFKNYMKGE